MLCKTIAALVISLDVPGSGAISIANALAIYSSTSNRDIQSAHWLFWPGMYSNKY